MCYLENSRMRGPWPAWGRSVTKKNYSYCFSTATMVTRTRLNVIRALPFLLNAFANNMRTYVYRFSYVRIVCDLNERCESILRFGCTIFILPFSPCLQIYSLLYHPSLFPMSLVRGNTARMFTQDYPAQATTGSHI